MNWLKSKNKKLTEALEKIKAFEKEISELKDRVGKNELMFQAVFKKAQETYSKGMREMMAASTRNSQYAMKLAGELAEKTIDEIKEGVEELVKTEIRRIYNEMIKPTEIAYSVEENLNDRTMKETGVSRILETKFINTPQIIYLEYRGSEYIAYLYEANSKKRTLCEKERSIITGSPKEVRQGIKSWTEGYKITPVWMKLQPGATGKNIADDMNTIIENDCYFHKSSDFTSDFFSKKYISGDDLIKYYESTPPLA